MKMQNLEPATIGGGKKANGHKANCACPICKNMKHAKKGGSKMQTLEPATIGGGKKANGHKATCKCPICINMKHQMVSKKNRRVTRRNRTMKGGVKRTRKGKIIHQNMNQNDDDDDDELPAANLQGQFDAVADDNDDDNNADNNANNEQIENNEEVENMDMDIEEEDVDEDEDSDYDEPLKRKRVHGGRKSRRGNGHKADCKCPICKNMRKSGKKGGVLSPYETEKPKETSTDQIDNMEKGIQIPLGEGAEKNVGGSRRRKSRKSRKSRKIRRRR